MFIEGLKISGYRSFNDEVEFDSLSKINLIIGQNNSGKSNLLRFLTRHLKNFKKEGTPFNDIEDKPKHGAQNLKVAFRFDKSSDLPALCAGNSINILNDVLFANIDTLWLYYNRSADIFVQDTESIDKVLRQVGVVPQQEWYRLWRALSGGQGGDPNHWKNDSIYRLNPVQKLNTQVDLIPAIRTLLPVQHRDGYSVGQDGYVTRNGIGDHSGIHLIEELFKLQSPKVGEENQRDRFDKINQFMREVIGNESLQLEIPHTQDSVIVNMDDKRLNIRELGSGIEEILIIAAKSTMFSNQIVCIEEPELHLHPTLQRKLLQYLYEKTDNQYFIATHSAHLLDSVESSIYHIKLVDGYSKIVSALNDQDKFIACNDLGYKASDLLQSNFIIWVEGPSDRIYLKHWIKSIDNSLIEGLHYSIMFYGGRLLSHLSVQDNTIDEFIALQRLNQNMAIVIDSDRRKKGENINLTKQRIRSEFENRGHLVWVTQGKEIENYLAPELYKKAVKSLYGTKIKTIAKSDLYEDMTVYYSGKQKKQTTAKKIDKIRLAHKIAEYKANLDVLDLNKQMVQLVKQISEANLMDV